MRGLKPKRKPDLGARLIAALQQALRERRLDVADALLHAIEIHDAAGGGETASAYHLIGEAARRPGGERRRDGGRAARWRLSE